MIKRFSAYDFDKTLMNTYDPEEGKPMWQQYYNKIFPYLGWWSKPESLDTNVFDIKPFPNVLNILNKDVSASDTYVVILTSRHENLQSEIQNILDVNNIHADKLDMHYDEKTKGQKVLEYIEKFPDLIEVNVYDDRESDIISYKEIINQISEDIKFNIYQANRGNLTLIDSNDKLTNIIKEEIQNFKTENNYVYHGTYDGAGYHIQRDGKMKINAANNDEPFISFTSKSNVAKYYADMKGGSARGIVFRTKKTDDFIPSPKYNKNNGYEWITTKEIPVEELEINTQYGWIPLNNWDFIDKNIKK